MPLRSLIFRKNLPDANILKPSRYSVLILSTGLLVATCQHCAVTVSRTTVETRMRDRGNAPIAV